MAFKIEPITNSAKGFGYKILLYGGTGVGKTFFAGTAQDVPELSDVLFVSLDGSTATLMGKQGVRKAEAFKAAEVEEVLWAFAQKKPEVAGIKTLVLDGCSELQKRDLADIAEAAAKDPNARRQRDQDINELGDYRINKSRLLRIFRMARDLPDLTVIMTAWDKRTYPKIPNKKGDLEQNKAAPPTEIGPDFTESLSDTLMGYCDAVWHLAYDKEKDRRLLYTGMHGVITAKTRNAAFAANLCTKIEDKTYPVLENPTFATIFAAYKKAQGGEKK